MMRPRLHAGGIGRVSALLIVADGTAAMDAEDFLVVVTVAAIGGHHRGAARRPGRARPRGRHRAAARGPDRTAGARARHVGVPGILLRPGARDAVLLRGLRARPAPDRRHPAPPGGPVAASTPHDRPGPGLLAADPRRHRDPRTL